jgi:hypothetical protein
MWRDGEGKSAGAEIIELNADFGEKPRADRVSDVKERNAQESNARGGLGLPAPQRFSVTLRIRDD